MQKIFPCIHSTIDQFELGVYNMPGTGLDAEDTAVDKQTEQTTVFMEKQTNVLAHVNTPEVQAWCYY